MSDEVNAESTYYQECGEYIRWSDDNADVQHFHGAVDKLAYHMKNDIKCIREGKLKVLLGTKKSLAQDFLKNFG